MAKQVQSVGTGEALQPAAGSREHETIQSNAGREFFTVSQLADLLQLTEMTIYRMINRGELPCYAIGRTKRFRRGDVEDFLQHCRVPAIGKQPNT